MWQIIKYKHLVLKFIGKINIYQVFRFMVFSLLDHKINYVKSYDFNTMM